MEKETQILSFLELPRKDPPETVRSKIFHPADSLLVKWFSQVSITSVNENGSVIQGAVRGGKTDFVRLLLEHG